MNADDLVNNKRNLENAKVQVAISRYQDKIRNTLPHDLMFAIGIDPASEFEVVDNSRHSGIKTYFLHGVLKLSGKEIPIRIESTHYLTKEFLEGSAFLYAKEYRILSARFDFHLEKASEDFHPNNKKQLADFLDVLRDRVERKA